MVYYSERKLKMKLKELLSEAQLSEAQLPSEKELFGLLDTEIMKLAKTSGRKSFNALNKVIKAG